MPKQISERRIYRIRWYEKGSTGGRDTPVLSLVLEDIKWALERSGAERIEITIISR